MAMRCASLNWLMLPKAEKDCSRTCGNSAELGAAATAGAGNGVMVAVGGGAAWVFWVGVLIGYFAAGASLPKGSAVTVTEWGPGVEIECQVYAQGHGDQKEL